MTINTMSKFLALFLILFGGCGKKHKEKDGGDASGIDHIKAKRELYLSLYPSVADSNGFIHTDECDSLLFSALSGVGGADVSLSFAEFNSLGEWHRRPSYYPECYPDHSKSTISRDMLIGVMWFAYEHQQLHTLVDLFEYGEDHNWIMGSGDTTRTFFTPNMQATLAELIYQMGGENHIVYRNLPRTWKAGLDDYELHLQLLHIELLGRAMGYISEDMLQVIKTAWGSFPDHPFVKFLYTKYVSPNFLHIVINDLRTDKIWPNNKLPTSQNYSDSWILQRTKDSDWMPKEGDIKTYSGGDFLFLSKMLLDYMDK